MNVFQKISDSIKLSIDSKVPMLLLGNPGITKTTTVRNFCESNGYGLVVLKGADYSPEDILGFPSNNDGKFERLLPDWLIEIRNNSEKGVRTLLFIDELTTSHELTQSALLGVIFDREVGTEKLPEDTIIISAGNYSGNLSNNFNMIPPILNRFMIMNLKSDYQTEDAKYILGVKPPRVNFTFTEINEEVVNPILISTTIYGFIKKLMDDEFIDLNNTELKNTYYGKDDVKGIPTLRSLHYFNLLTRSAFRLGLVNSVFKDLINGLIGVPTGVNATTVENYDVGASFIKFLSKTELSSKMNIVTVSGLFNTTTGELKYDAIEKLTDEDIKKLESTELINLLESAINNIHNDSNVKYDKIQLGRLLSLIPECMNPSLSTQEGARLLMIKRDIDSLG